MRKCLLLAAGFFMLFTFSAYAQQKIAYIDIKQVIRDSKAGKAANASFGKGTSGASWIARRKSVSARSDAPCFW